MMKRKNHLLMKMKYITEDVVEVEVFTKWTVLQSQLMPLLLSIIALILLALQRYQNRNPLKKVVR